VSSTDYNRLVSEFITGGLFTYFLQQTADKFFNLFIQ